MIALAALLVYLWLAPAHIVDGDNAEFATLGAIGGVAHPSGYPLYLIWLRAMAWLPSQSPAHAAAMATAILGAAQILVLHAACRAWGARATAASLAVAIFAAGPVVLRIDTEAEVFALNGLVCATVLWLSAAHGPLRGVPRAAMLGLVAGLGMSDHLTCVLVAPVGLLGFVHALREAPDRRLLSAGVAVLGLVLGLTPYLYLLATPETQVSWGRIDDLTGLVHHFLRSDYGGPGSFSPHGIYVPGIVSAAAMVQTILRAWLWAPVVLGLGTLGFHIARAHGPESRLSWGLLAGSFVLAGPVLATRFNVDPVGLGLYVCQRFHILPALLLAVPIAVGFDHLGTWLLTRITGDAMRSVALGGVLSTVAFLAFTGLSLPRIAAVHSRAVELGIENLLRTLPPDAVVITVPDYFHFGAGYVQGALGERTDVVVIEWPQVPSQAYRDRLERRTGIKIVKIGTGARSVDVAEQVLATGRPLFIDGFGAGIATSYATYPYGLLFRVLPHGEKNPPIEEVYAINRALFQKFDLRYSTPGTDDDFATELHDQYARVWQIIAKSLGVAGRHAEEAEAVALARALAPHDD